MTVLDVSPGQFRVGQKYYNYSNGWGHLSGADIDSYGFTTCTDTWIVYPPAADECDPTKFTQKHKLKVYDDWMYSPACMSPGSVFYGEAVPYSICELCSNN
jgi:hypothetical protein